MVMKNKKYIAYISLYEKGKRQSYGGTTRQVYAMNTNEARKKMIKQFKFKDNVVKVRITKAKSNKF